LKKDTLQHLQSGLGVCNFAQACSSKTQFLDSSGNAPAAFGQV